MLPCYRLCDSSGEWTGSAPQCRLISCGDPPMLPHSAVALLNGSTQWRSQAVYSCLPGFQTNNRGEPDSAMEPSLKAKHKVNYKKPISHPGLAVQ